MTKIAIALNVFCLAYGLLLMVSDGLGHWEVFVVLVICPVLNIHVISGRWPHTFLFAYLERKTLNLKMKKRTIAFWLIAQVLLVVLLWTSAVLQVMTMQFDAQDRTQPVVLAATDLPAQTRLTAKQVQVVKMRDYGLPPDCLTSSAHVIGAKLIVDISQGQPLTADLIAREIEPFLPPGGMRAFTLSLSRDDAGVGFVRPGSIVDLHVTFPIDDKKIGEFLVIAPLQQQLRVLAIDALLASSRNVRVTLEVTDKQAGALQLAMKIGRLALVLRNPMDRTFQPVQPMVLKQGRFEAFGEPLDPQDPLASLNLMRVPPGQPAPEPVQDAADPRGEKK